MTISVFLQAASDSLAPVAAATVKTQELSLWYLLKEGGLLMIPLGICSVIAVYVFAERLMAIRNASKTGSGFMLRIREKISEGQLTAAEDLCKNNTGAVPNVIAKGISRIGKPIDHIEKSMENAGKLEIYTLEKNLGILSTIAGIAPMFGFLGTIAGMIILFYDIQTKGFNLDALVGGIYTKMVTSAVGLIIGLLSYVAYNYLNAQINKAIYKIEAAATEFLDILHQPVR